MLSQLSQMKQPAAEWRLIYTTLSRTDRFYQLEGCVSAAFFRDFIGDYLVNVYQVGEDVVIERMLCGGPAATMPRDGGYGVITVRSTDALAYKRRVQWSDV